VKTKIISICAALVCVLSLNGNVAAQERDFKTALEECFWGLILTSEDQRGLALGLNVVSGALGSYAYTSATASADTFCAEKTASTAAFINEAYPSLIEDAARGTGEHLVAVLELAGCDAQGQAAAMPLVRTDMAEALSAPGYDSSEYLNKVVTLYESVNLRAEQACKVG
jgi:hypothetical protein